MRRLLTSALAALTLTTACGSPPTTTPSGQPATASSGQPTTASSGQPTTTPSGRPREVVLDTGQPCALLKPDQLTELGIDAEGKPLPIQTYRTTGCSWRTDEAGHSLIPVTTEGIEAWTSGSRTARPTPTDPVLGFPAITVTLPTDEDSCDVVVDTAEGQYLIASHTALRDPHPDPCDGARELAEAAVRTLLG